MQKLIEGQTLNDKYLNELKFVTVHYASRTRNLEAEDMSWWNTTATMTMKNLLLCF